MNLPSRTLRVLNAFAFLNLLFGFIIFAVTAGAQAFAGPPIGINISVVDDYSPERLFADAFKEARDWQTIGGGAEASTDADGWPTQDAQLYVWAGLETAAGTYALSFNGQATISAGGVISHQAYDANTNTTTATLTFSSGDTNLMAFTNTKRTAASLTDTGLANIKLMRPLTPGSTSTYAPNIIFTNQIKTLISKFSVIRFMDFLSTNSNPQVSWSDRTRPARFSQQRFQGAFFSTPNMGAAIEYAVELCNETDTSMWINVPAKANDGYILNLANLLAYGSDGVNPYTSPQTNPVWAPLNPQLKIYIEYSNEVWNTAPAFQQSNDNHLAAIAEVNAGGSPLNFDGDTNDYDWAARRTAKRTVEISNIFRSVFGDAAMPARLDNGENADPRVRPVLESQLGYAAFWHYQQTHLLQDYYNSSRVSNPRPPSYYIYGGGGSAYYNPNNSGPWDLNSVWESNTFSDGAWAQAIVEDMGYDLPNFGHRIAYEGGPSLDRTATAVDALKEQVWSDPRMTEKVSGHQEIWNQQGGGLLVYFDDLGDYQWGFSHSVDDLATAKFAGIDSINGTSPAPSSGGVLLPTSLNAAAAAGPAYANPSNLQALGDQPSWIGYLVTTPVAAAFRVSLVAGSTGPGNVADLYIDGWLVGSINVSDTGSNGTQQSSAILTTPVLSAGEHGLLVKAKSGSFGFSSLVIADLQGGLLPSAPGTLTSNASDGQVTLYWGAAQNAVSYSIYRGTSAQAENSTPLATGVNGLTFTDTTVVNGTTYYYTVAGVDNTGTGTRSNETTASPNLPPPPHDGITSVRFFPRANWATRMVGGLFQGSNDDANWTTLAEVTNQPPDGVYTTLQVSNATVWRYVRYLGPDNGSSNVAEIEFYHNGTKLTGVAFGSPGSYGGGSNTFDKALDGSTGTYFDAPDSSGDYVGLDLGVSSTTLPVAPQGVTATALDQQVIISWSASSDANTYSLYRGIVAGGEGGTAVAIGLTGTQYIDTTVTNGTTYYYNLVGVNATGSGTPSAEISATPSAGASGGNHTVTSVRFYPRPNWSQRMVGGKFQGSNDSASWTTLVTVVDQPADGAWTTLTVSNGTNWRYVRYLGPDNGSCDVAEVQFYHGATQLTGSGFGSPGSWNNGSNTFDKAIDGSITTYFDAVNSSGDYVGLDLGSGTAPATPTQFSATPGNGKITLSWNASNGATSYIVYRALTAGAEGTTPFASGITTANYIDAGLTNGITYFYTVAAVSADGTSSASAEVSAAASAPAGVPSITQQPVSQTKSVGDNVTFTVAASGAPTLLFQWRKEGVPISGNSSARTATLTLDTVDTLSAGNYDVVVTNSAGRVESVTATLSIQKAIAQVSLSNLSQVYNATPRAVAVTTVPTGLNVDVTYNGAANLPVKPGNYAIVATVDDPDFSGSTAGTLVITGTSISPALTTTPTVSINFVGGYPGNIPASLSGNEIAGVVPAEHWNNASGVSGQGMNLVDQTGASTGASLSWNAAGGTWASGIGTGSSDHKLMEGYLDTAEGEVSTITITNLPARFLTYGYDVYLYTDGSNSGARRVAKYSIGAKSITAIDAELTDFNGSYIQAAGSPGNFVRFANLTSNTISVTAAPVSSSDAFQRAPINGVQIVAHAPLRVTLSGFVLNRRTGHIVQQVTLTNQSSQTIVGPIYFVVDGLSANTSLTNANGVTLTTPPFGDPYVIVSSSGLGAGLSVTTALEFTNPASGGITYTSRAQNGPVTP